MGTAVADDEVTPFTAVMAYKDEKGRWSVTVNDGPSSPCGVAKGQPGESFDIIFDAAIDDLRSQVNKISQQVFR